MCGRMTTTPELLTVNAIREHYGLSRNLTHDLLPLMPHVKIGRAGRGERLMVRRADIERLLARAAEEQRDLLDLVRDFTPDTLRVWLAGGSQGVN